MFGDQPPQGGIVFKFGLISQIWANPAPLHPARVRIRVRARGEGEVTDPARCGISDGAVTNHRTRARAYAVVCERPRCLFPPRAVVSSSAATAPQVQRHSGGAAVSLGNHRAHTRARYLTFTVTFTVTFTRTFTVTFTCTRSHETFTQTFSRDVHLYTFTVTFTQRRSLVRRSHKKMILDVHTRRSLVTFTCTRSLETITRDVQSSCERLV